MAIVVVTCDQDTIVVTMARLLSISDFVAVIFPVWENGMFTII